MYPISAQRENFEKNAKRSILPLTVLLSDDMSSLLDGTWWQIMAAFGDPNASSQILHNPANHLDPHLTAKFKKK